LQPTAYTKLAAAKSAAPRDTEVVLPRSQNSDKQI